jgi:hypothetical protein
LVGRRDAFHVPAILVRSNDFVTPGEGLRFVDDALTEVVTAGYGTRQAVADPFVSEINQDSFWALLMPDTVQNLTHNFEVNIEIDPYLGGDGECRTC